MPHVSDELQCLVETLDRLRINSSRSAKSAKSLKVLRFKSLDLLDKAQGIRRARPPKAPLG